MGSTLADDYWCRKALLFWTHCPFDATISEVKFIMYELILLFKFYDLSKVLTLPTQKPQCICSYFVFIARSNIMQLNSHIFWLIFFCHVDLNFTKLSEWNSNATHDNHSLSQAMLVSLLAGLWTKGCADVSLYHCTPHWLTKSNVSPLYLSRVTDGSALAYIRLVGPLCRSHKGVCVDANTGTRTKCVWAPPVQQAR